MAEDLAAVAPHCTNSPSLRLIQNWWRKVIPPLSLWMMAREPRWFSSPISPLRGWYTWARNITICRISRISKYRNSIGRCINTQACVAEKTGTSCFIQCSYHQSELNANMAHIQSLCHLPEMVALLQPQIAPSSWVPQPTKTVLRSSTHTWVTQMISM